jgi:hypothetical protein
MRKFSLTLLIGFVAFVGYLSVSKMLGFGDFTNWLEVEVGGDKILHFGIASILCLLSMMAFDGRFSWWKIMGVLMGLLLCEELMQFVLPNRYFGFDDLLAGWGGLLWVGILYKATNILIEKVIK